jgi:hypothetical protein
MISLQRLFEDVNFNSVPKKYKKRMTRKCKIFKGFEEEIPELFYPELGTEKFEEDLGEVRRCVKNPSLTDKFLKISDKDSEEVFKKFLKDEDIDWDELDKVFKEFDGIMLRQKFKYDRKRPFVYFKDRGENIETESAHSPSFPSGHTAFAYLISSYFSNLFPEKAMQLQTIAEMIAQSRIENGVHFPSDIDAGRFLGEQAADFLTRKSSLDENFINRSNQKVFIKFLRKRALALRPTFSKKESLKYFVNDVSFFLNESTGAREEECQKASESFLEGYPIHICTDNKEIHRMLEGMLHIFFAKQEDFSDFSKLNRILESKSEIRNDNITTMSGFSHAPANKIVEYAPRACKIKDKPFLKLASISWIAPFKSGNRKITNLTFLKETNFNFDITNQIIADELDFILENFYAENKMEKILS